MTRWRILGTESGVQNGGRAVGRRFVPTYAIRCQWARLSFHNFRHAFFIGRIDVVCSRRTYIVHMSVEKPGRAVAWPA